MRNLQNPHEEFFFGGLESTYLNISASRSECCFHGFVNEGEWHQRVAESVELCVRWLCVLSFLSPSVTLGKAHGSFFFL